MSRRSKNNRRTMPPLPAAGVRPLSHDEPSLPEAAGKEEAKPPFGAGLEAAAARGAVPPQPAKPASPPPSPPAANVAPPSPQAAKSNPINMALLELQEEMGEASQAMAAWS